MGRKQRSRDKSKGRSRRWIAPSQQAVAKTKTYYELEVIPGLADFTRAELQERMGDQVRLLPSVREDRVPFRFAGRPDQLLQLRQSVAVHRVTHFGIPRPKALLGHQNFETLVRSIGKVRALHRPGSFKTFHISAAGSSSSVFSRIKREIETRTGLQCVDEVGDLSLAVRRPERLAVDDDGEQTGWEVALRLSPRPLSARPWRVCDMPGALNATVANVMMSLTRPSTEDQVLNMACGSGTLLIERLTLGPVQAAIGCDIDSAALACAQRNLDARGNASPVALMRCDVGRMPFIRGWATAVCVDLPFGMLVGSHQSNEVLYPRLLEEAGRLTRVRGKLVAITQQVRLFERVAAAQEDQWVLARVIPIKLPANTRDGYIHPRIYLLQRR